MLSHVAGNGHAAVKLLLAKNGVNPDSRDNFSQTPLSRAAMFGHVAVVALLHAQNRERLQRRHLLEKRSDDVLADGEGVAEDLGQVQFPLE